MTAPVLAMIGCAVAVWCPRPRAATRLGGLGDRRPQLPAPATVAGALRHAAGGPGAAVGAGAAGVLVGIATTGIATGIALGVVGSVVAAATRDALRRRSERRAEEVFAEVVDAIAAELRAGRPPAAALSAAAACGRGALARTLRDAASLAAYGGSPTVALRGGQPVPAGHGSGPPARGRGPGRPAQLVREVAVGMDQLAAAWEVSERSGAALADVLDQVAHSVRAGCRERSELAALLAGPRATAGLLALLPLVGLALGGAMGAHPIHVLTTSPIGEVALAVGAGLDGAGVLWTARIVRAAERRCAGGGPDR